MAEEPGKRSENIFKNAVSRHNNKGLKKDLQEINRNGFKVKTKQVSKNKGDDNCTRIKCKNQPPGQGMLLEIIPGPVLQVVQYVLLSRYHDFAIQ